MSWFGGNPPRDHAKPPSIACWSFSHNLALMLVGSPSKTPIPNFMLSVRGSIWAGDAIASRHVSPKSIQIVRIVHYYFHEVLHPCKVEQCEKLHTPLRRTSRYAVMAAKTRRHRRIPIGTTSGASSYCKQKKPRWGSVALSRQLTKGRNRGQEPENENGRGAADKQGWPATLETMWLSRLDFATIYI